MCGVDARAAHQHIREPDGVGHYPADRLEHVRYGGHPGSGGTNGITDSPEDVAEDVALSVVSDGSLLLILRAAALSWRILWLIGSFTQF
jgi:hypothetical protein